jgi:hypothetical protein
VFDFIVRIKEKCDSLDLPHDALRRHAKLLFKGEALIWFRMIESSVSSWTDICDRLKEEFLPIGYYDTARDKLLNYHQTAGQTIGMFLAKFDQLEGYLPRPLPFERRWPRSDGTFCLITKIACGIKRSFRRTSCTVFVAGWMPLVSI